MRYNPIMRIPSPVIALLIFPILLTPAWGDHVILKNGNKYVGKIVYRKSYIRVQTKRGLRTFKWKKIKSIAESPLHDNRSKEEKQEIDKNFQRKKKNLNPNDPIDHYQFGKWCLSKGLVGEAKWAFEETIRWKANHHGARKALGYVKEDGKWQKKDDLYKEKVREKNPRKRSQYLALAKWCKRHGLEDREEELARIILRKNNFDRKAIKILKRTTTNYVPKRHYIFPLKGRYKILRDRTNHHQMKAFAIWAYDIVKINELGKRTTGYGGVLTDHVIWNQPVYAVGDGVVRYVAEKFPDNKIGKIGKMNQANKVLIDHGGGEFSFYLHLKQNSITVEVGDKVKAGQMIGRVGNSGASGAPHLHFTMMDRDYFSKPVWFKNFVREIDKDEKVLFQVGKPEEDNWVVKSLFKGYFQTDEARK